MAFVYDFILEITIKCIYCLPAYNFLSEYKCAHETKLHSFDHLSTTIAYRALKFCHFVISAGNLKKLSILKADQNSLAFIPACIGDCHQLTELMLTENLLTDLPPTLGNLQLLSALNVDKNQVASLPKEVRCATKRDRVNVLFLLLGKEGLCNQNVCCRHPRSFLFSLAL